MNKTLISIFSTLVLAAALLNTGCKKKEQENNGNGTFILKGRIMEDCNRPGADHQLQLHRMGNWVTPFRDVGAAKTNSDGYFEMVCKNYGSGDFIMGDARGFDWFDGKSLNVTKDGILDLGTMYVAATSSAFVRIEFKGAYGPNDTFIIGHPSTKLYLIHPIPKFDIKMFEKLSFYYPYVGSNSNVGIFYGIGQKDFDSARTFANINGGDVPQYNALILKAEPCILPDTTVLNIN